jgi:hypothetical protein
MARAGRDLVHVEARDDLHESQRSLLAFGDRRSAIDGDHGENCSGSTSLRRLAIRRTDHVTGGFAATR